jgi:hypothetical protein
LSFPAWVDFTGKVVGVADGDACACTMKLGGVLNTNRPMHLAPNIGGLRVREQFAGKAIVEKKCVEDQKNTSPGSIFQHAP